MKTFFLFLVFFTPTFSLFAQKEEYFTDKKPSEVKLQSLSGFELNTKSFFSGITTYNFYLGYMHEKALGQNISITSSVGLRNAFYELPLFVNGIFQNKSFCALSLEMAVEPRWYWTLQRQYELGNDKLNSGWFLSAPLRIEPLSIRTPDEIYNFSWFPTIYYFGISLTPSVGFRQALSERFYLEGLAGIGILDAFCKGGSTGIQFSSELKLKAVYTFK